MSGNDRTFQGKAPHRWGRDDEAVCAAIRANRSTLKLILKTRNEDFFIERWLEHYLAILDPEDKIIVLDNMSDSERVFSVYERHAHRIILAQYEGHVDSAHSLRKFAAMYDAVMETSQFYALLDTDEFLHLHDGRKLLRNNQILRYLRHNADAALCPTLFLTNVFAREDALICEEDDLRTYHCNGKPLLNSALMREKLRTPVGHTRNLPAAILSGRAPLSFVLFHLTRLSREQRITANLQKLRSFGLIRDEKDLSFLERVRDEQIESPSIRAYLAELRKLAGMRDEAAVTTEDLRRDHFIVKADGSLEFSAPRVKELFLEHTGPK